ncbi:MAG: hypothetical protein HY814_06455 [Candidatus Riflebacteria bacterium]|nr:hypothetical protein [Candidatus Riflebacteria bacterium]
MVIAFAMSLAAPIVEAQTQTPAPAATSGLAGAVNTAKNTLAKLWGAWAARPVPPGVPANYKPTLGEAFSFFVKNGATPQQAEILANNAQASGHVVGTPMSPTQAPQGILQRLFGFGSSSKTPVAETPTTQQPNLTNRIGTQIKDGWNRVVTGGKRAADTVVTGAQTAAFTVGDKFDFNKYYELPLGDNTAVKFRGQWESTVKFTDGKWVIDSTSSTSKWPAGVVKSGDAVARIEELAVGMDQGKVTQSGMANVADKIKNFATGLRDRIFGSKSPKLSADQAQDLGKLEIEGHLMEQARSIVDAQKAIQNRITELTTKAQNLNKPVPSDEIARLQKGYDTLEAQKTEIAKRLDRATSTPTKTILKDAATWALYSVGITAGINVIGQVVNGEKIDIKKAFSFVAQPSFWGGTAGGFVGSMLFQTLASSFLPPGMGIFFKVLPGFLGAAFGYQIGSGLLGGGPTNWVQTIGQTLASAGGYALAYSLLGGAAAPGIALVGASIAAGAVANFLLGKLFNKGQPTAEVADLSQPLVPAAEPPPVELATPPAATTMAEPPPAASQTTASLDGAAAAQEMKTAYNEYINMLKERKVADARLAYDRYVKAKESLDKSRESATR